MEAHREHHRRRLPSVGALVSDSVNDVLALLGALPEITSTLRAIARHTAHMDAEVTGMHSAIADLRVDISDLRSELQELRTDVQALGAQIAPLPGGIDQVVAGVERLEPHVADLSRVMRPLRRVRSRLTSPAPVPLDPDGDEPVIALSADGVG